MKKKSVFLLALFAGLLATQANAQPAKAPMRSAIFNTLPSGYQQLGNTSIYYSIDRRQAAGPGYQYGVSILGKIGNRYYSSTYQPEDQSWIFTQDRPGAGFIAAFQVNDAAAVYLNALNGTTSNGVTVTARLEPSGEVAARIVYTLANNNSQAVTVNAGVWGDIMIGDNDQAPLERLATSAGATYGIKMKYANIEDTPLLCALFGDGVTGTTPADDYWFGFFSSNWYADEIIGNYSSTIHATNTDWGQSYAQYYMAENGNYDSGLGFCWKNREIPAGESIELSYLVSVGEIDFEEPIDPDPEPGEDIFTYEVEAYNFDAWNDLTVAHPAHIWGHYEHPYGQSGYIEYQVDDENTWHRIPTPLVSGEAYDLPFDMIFNESRDTDHVLKLRFTDGLDNNTDLEGLTWTDVRSYNVEGLENRVYDGQPQEFVVTINGVTETYVGETVPGTYSFTIEGEFDDNTIAVKEVPYMIDRAECQYEATLPEAQIKYDGLQHGATVTVPEGSGNVTVVYKDLTTGEESTTAPSEVGRYVIIVSIDDSGEYYYGMEETIIWNYEIYLKYPTGVNELNGDSEDNDAWYTIDGQRFASPTQRGIYIHEGKKYIVK